LWGRKKTRLAIAHERGGKKERSRLQARGGGGKGEERYLVSKGVGEPLASAVGEKREKKDEREEEAGGGRRKRPDLRCAEIRHSPQTRGGRGKKKEG